MSDTAILVDRNRHFAEGFSHGGLAIKPRLSTIVLTCLDARVDPARFFELELGDAVVMRNAGGRVTDGVLRDMAVLGYLASLFSGGSETKPELVVVHHTDCGTSRLADPEAQRAVAKSLGIEPAEVEAMAMVDAFESVADDIQRLCVARSVPGGLVVSGYVYDVAVGTVTEVVAPVPLGALR